MPLFESYDRRIKQINEALAKYGIGSIEEAEQLCLSKGINVREIVNGIQPIAFENAGWAYVVGAAIAIKKGCTKAADAAEAIGEGLQSFCIPGSVADDRKVGLGHGNLAAMLLRDETECFCFLAGHESFAAAEGAIGIAKSANRVRKQDLRVMPERPRQGCRVHHLPHQWLHVRADQVRLCHGQAEHRPGEGFLQGPEGRCARATAATTCAKAWPSCGMKAWTSPSPGTPPTRPASSTR